MSKTKTPYKLIVDLRHGKSLSDEESKTERQTRHKLDRLMRKYFKDNALRYKHLSLKESGRLNSILSFKSGMSIRTPHVTRIQRRSDEWFGRTTLQ